MTKVEAIVKMITEGAKVKYKDNVNLYYYNKENNCIMYNGYAVKMDKNDGYEIYVEPKKTKKIEVADYYMSLCSIYQYSVRTFEIDKRAGESGWKKVIGSERTIEIEE